MPLKDYSGIDQVGDEPGVPLLLVASSMPLRIGFRTILNATVEFTVIAESGTLEGLLPFLHESGLIVLVDQSVLSPTLERLLRVRADLAFLLLVNDVLELTHRLYEKHAIPWGVLPLDTTAEALTAALRALHEGLTVGTPTLLERFFTAHTGEDDHERALTWEMKGAEPLTERENQVLQLLADGLANKQIGLSLGISEHTVKFHISAIYAKLEASNRAEAVRIGVKRGLITL
jgi:DNA-binding NarL/FixJ family response regulator